MELIESFIQSKTGKIEDCEDKFIVTDYFAAVIDGASNVSNKLLNGRTPGELASHIIKNTIEQLDGHEQIEDIIDAINQQYQTTYNDLGITKPFNDEPYLRPSAAMVVYSNYHRKIWMIGDCQCYFNQQLYQNIKHVDEVFEEARSIVVKGELIAGKSTNELQAYDPGYELIRPFIQKQYNFQNEIAEYSLGYGVVNGLTIPQSLIKELSVPDDTNYISFGSDGYNRIYDSLEATEKKLKELNEIDPLCIHENLGIKAIVEGNVSFDDRTYIKIKV